jgi:tRNA(Glu) U13 pseudouridine synthase TruD
LDGEFIGIHVLNKDFIKALEIYCTTIRPSDLAFIKADKRALLAAWPGVMDVHVKDKVLKNIVITLGKTQDFKSAYEQIPEFERKMHMQAVASYVWNEALKVDLKVARLYKPFSVPYAAGSLLFGDIKGTMATTVSSTAMDVVIKESNTPAAVMEWIDVERESMITVSKGSILDVSDDELAKSKGLQKLTVTFELPTGSYATIVVKNVFRS